MNLEKKEEFLKLKERLPTLWIYSDGKSRIASDEDLEFFFDGVKQLVARKVKEACLERWNLEYDIDKMMVEAKIECDNNNHRTVSLKFFTVKLEELKSKYKLNK